MDLQDRYPSLAFAWPRPGVLEITLKGEKLNALGPEAHRDLARVWQDLRGLEEVRVVLLRGEGGVFSAGGSFALIEEMRASHHSLMRVLWEARELVLGPLDFPRPVVVAVEDGRVYEKALEVAQRLAEGPKEALSFTKHALNHWFRTFLPHFEVSLALEFLGFQGEELEEGLRALKERGKPQF